jgi:two-component system NarL family sensor kinase
LRALRSPVTYFLVIAVATVGAILLGTNGLADRAARQEAINEAGSTTEILAQSVVAPAVPRGLVHLSPSSSSKLQAKIIALDSELRPRMLDVERVFRINIWSRDARLLYSTQLSLVDDYLESNIDLRLDEQQRAVLREGGVESEIADPDRPEDRATITESGDQDLIRVYTRMESPEGRPLLLEAYFALDEIDARQAQIFSSFRWITLAALGLLVIVAGVILAGLTRRLGQASTERERLLHSAMDASDAERRRIARDLHDSVVQDLAGTAFSVSAVARTPGIPEESKQTLDAAGASLRTGLKSLRSLLAEIHPPDLKADGLPAALADLIAPASTLGMQASVSVEGAETASDPHVALVWRVAQEAARNAMRHSQASTLAVTVRGDGRTLALEVVDDGNGFDPARVTPDSYGLRGLRSLVTDSGGVLEVRSSPGEGTTVWMEVDAQ